LGVSEKKSAIEQYPNEGVCPNERLLVPESRFRVMDSGGPKLLLCIAAATLASLLCSCGGSSTSISIQIEPAPGQSITCTGTSALTCSLDSGATINFVAAVGGDSKNQGVCWSLPGTTTSCGTTTGTGTGCAGSGVGAGQCGALSNQMPFSVTYTAPPSISSSITVTITATSITQHAATSTVTLTVELAPTFSAPCISTPATCPLPNAANGVAYSETLTITGGVSPYTYSVSSGSLPACLNLNGLANSTSTTITGTPCSSGLSNFTVQLKDSGGIAITQAFSISVTPPPPLSITTTSLPQGLTNVSYQAFILTTGGVAPLKWSVSGGSLPAGLALNGATGQVTGVPMTAGTSSFQVTVTDSSLPAPGQKAGPATISITIANPLPLSITTSALPTASVATAYSGSLQATGGVAPYTWTITQGLLPSGLTFASLSNGSGQISGTPVLTTTATLTVQVTDSEVVPATRTATFTLTVNAGTANPNSLISGSYAFLFNGFDTDPQTKVVGSVAIAGTLTADGNGNITTGEEDSNRLSGIVNGITLSGTYAMGTDGRGTLTLTAVNGQGTTLITDYDLVLDSSGNVRFFEDNTPVSTNLHPDISGTHGMGILKPMQASSFTTGSLSGNYAFEFSGEDFNGAKEALAGVVQADGSGDFNPGGGGPNGDFSDAGTYSSPPPTISGAFSVAAMSSRGLASFLFQPATKSATTLNFVFYFVSPNDLFFVEYDTPETTFPNPPRLSGEMILQQPSFAFTSTALAGSSVATGSGVDGSNASVFAGLLSATTCDGSTPISFSYDQNDGGTLASPSFTSGTCIVQSNGRAVFTGLGSGGQSRAAVAYLTGPGQGFLFGSDSAVTTGRLDQQSGAPFSLSSIQGGYTLGAPAPAEANVSNLIGQAFCLTGNGSLIGTVDEYDAPTASATEGVADLDQSLIATINSLATDGRGTMTTNLAFPVNVILYMVSPASIRAISADGDANPQVITFDH
jgi:hypothetical protein